MSDTAPAVHDNRTAFPLATLVALLMLGTFLILTAMTAGPWLFTRGAGVAFEVVISALPNFLLHLAFVLMLPKGSPWVAGAFGIWCVWGFIDSLSGASNTFTALFGYAFGVLNFIGIVGVYKGFNNKAFK